MAGEVKSAEEATQIAKSFVLKQRLFARAIKAVRQDDIWVVEIDVGPIFVSLATVKLDASTGTIVEYNMPA